MGGNIFSGKTQSIKKEFIKPTLNNYFKELTKLFPKKKAMFNIKDMKPVGSVGKKPYSGDIDLLIDVSKMLDSKMSDKSIAEWNINPEDVQKKHEQYAKRARTATPEQLRLRAFLYNLVMYINKHAENIYSDEKKITSGNIFSLYPQYDGKEKLDFGVQVDWMVSDNVDWAMFSYNSTDEYTGKNDSVKGGNRTQLILSLFNYLDYTFNHVNGVKNKENKVIAKSPEESIDLLNREYEFIRPITRDILDSYWKTVDFLKNNVTAREYHKIIGNYLRIIDKQRLPVPENLYNFWIKNQKEFGLTGKFVPEWQHELLNIK